MIYTRYTQCQEGANDGNVGTYADLSGKGPEEGMQAKAKANGTKVAEEVRRAVDAYLAGISQEDLHLLDVGTAKGAPELRRNGSGSGSLNATLDAAFAELNRSRAKRRRSAGRSLPSAGVEVLKE
jgi:hypothetical protein